MAKADTTLVQIAKDFAIRESVLYKWVKQNIMMTEKISILILFLMTSYSFAHEGNKNNTSFKNNTSNFMIETTKPDGEYQEYYKNGNIKSKAYYKNNRLNASRIMYYQDGRVWHKLNYKNGKAEGIQMSYHSNGKISMSAYFKNNRPDGKLIRYYDNGKIASNENYKEGWGGK